MSWRNKVVWSQGMFLQPHHFQQEARYVEHLVDLRVRAAGAYAWGFFELVLDEGLMAVGKLAVARASGILTDGTPFMIPQIDAAPIALELGADAKDEVIYLTAPMARAGVTEVNFDDAPAAGPTRYRAVDDTLPDQTSASDEPEPVQTAALNLRLVRQRDAGEGDARLGIAQVVECRDDGQLILESAYIAPQVRLNATAQLSSIASLLHGLVQQRARALASRMGQFDKGGSELADFLMLQALNRAEPQLRQHASAPLSHPTEFHRCCLQLAGDLASLASESRYTSEYALYRHDDLRGTFAPLIADLRRMLSVVLERNAFQIPLVERTHGVRTAVIPDAELAKGATFVLAVNAQLPGEQLRQRFTSQSKLGPADRIRDIVNLALPGVVLRPLPVAPRQLPYHAGFHYFELERSGELWKQVERSLGIALHVGGDFPGLELEFWAIRQ